MSFFYSRDKNKKIARKQQPLPFDTLRSMECKACPMNMKGGSLCNPKMEPTGENKIIFYQLGGAPSKDDDKNGEQFSDEYGEYLRSGDIMPQLMAKSSRWNNSIRCRPENDRDPNDIEIECCSPSIERDIEKSKPFMVMGYGGIALKSIIRESNIYDWRGRILPVKFGNYVCWFMPTIHPYTILKNKYKEYQDENERAFRRDLKRACGFYIDSKKEPIPFVDSGYLDGIEFVLGNGDSDYRTVVKWLSKAKEWDYLGFDFETQNLRPYEDNSRLLTVSISNGEITYAFPLDHPKAWGDVYRKKMIELFGSFIRGSGKKICHNLNMEMEWAAYYYGIDVIDDTEWEDTYAMGYVIDERKGMLNLGVLTQLSFGFNVKKLSPVFDKSNMVAEDLNEVLPYNGLDSKWTYYLFWELKHRMELECSEKQAEWVYPHHLRMSNTLTKTQIAGVLIDKKQVFKFEKDYKSKLLIIEEKLFDTDEVITYQKRKRQKYNPDSNPQTLYILKDILKRQEIYTDGGMSTKEHVLSSIPESETIFPKLLLEYREYAKLYGTYILPMKDRHIKSDGRMHCQYNDKFTSTGRLSAEDPNSQNWPKKKNKEIRKMIAAPPGYKIASNDYGSIEARIVAMASEDQIFCEALWNRYDTHAEWRDIIIDIYPPALEELSEKTGITDKVKLYKLFREGTKHSLVFAEFFGGSVKRITAAFKNFDIYLPEEIVEEIDQEFWNVFKGVKKWHKYLREFYNKHGYVETLTGRRRHEPLRYNELINLPVQGTGGDIFNDSFNRCADAGYPLIMNVHDDNMFYISDYSLEEDIANIAKIMCFPPFDWINVPIVVETSIGNNWYEQEKYKEFWSDEF